MQVGEIAAAAAGDQNFLADAIRALDQQDAPAPLSRFHRTHQAGRAGSEDDDVVFLIHAALFNSTCRPIETRWRKNRGRAFEHSTRRVSFTGAFLLAPFEKGPPRTSASRDSVQWQMAGTRQPVSSPLGTSDLSDVTAKVGTRTITRVGCWSRSDAPGTA